MIETPVLCHVDPEPVPDKPDSPDFQQILAALHTRYPQCFPLKGAERKALKIGINADLQARGSKAKVTRKG